MASAQSDGSPSPDLQASTRTPPPARPSPASPFDSWVLRLRVGLNRPDREPFVFLARDERSLNPQLPPAPRRERRRPPAPPPPQNSAHPSPCLPRTRGNRRPRPPPDAAATPVRGERSAVAAPDPPQNSARPSPCLPRTNGGASNQGQPAGCRCDTSRRRAIVGEAQRPRRPPENAAAPRWRRGRRDQHPHADGAPTPLTRTPPRTRRPRRRRQTSSTPQP